MRLENTPPDRPSSSFLDPTQPFDPLDKGNYDMDQKSNSRAINVFHIMSFFLIGTSSWLLVTGIFTECNVLVNEKISPEGRRIFAASDLAIELGNIAPFILVVYFSKFLNRNTSKLVAGVIVLDILTALFLAFSYNKIILNSSVFFLTGCFFSGVAGSTSMMCYFAFASNYGSVAITSLSTGIGFTGLIGLMFGIIQGYKPPVVYSPMIYFCCLAIIFVFSFVGYIIAVKKKDRQNEKDLLSNSLLDKFDPDEIVLFNEDTDDEMKKLMRRSTSEDIFDERGYQDRSIYGSTKGFFSRLLNPIMRGVKSNIMPRPSPFIAIYISCLTEFGVPSILPYLIPCSLQKTGASFWMTFFFLTGSIGGRILTSIVSYRNFLVLNSVQTGLFVYLIVVASLQGSNTDGVVPIPISFFLMFMLSFVHGFIVTEVFQCVSDNKTMSSWAGLSNQAGALSGSLITFTIVQMGLFKECKH